MLRDLMKKTIKGSITMMLIMGMSIGMASAAEPSTDPVLKISTVELEKVLTIAIQDEYNAQATYEAIVVKFGVDRPFSNIIKAEKQHEAYLAELFKDYGYEIPVNDAAKNVTLPATLEEALKVAVQAEKDNIVLYQGFIDRGVPTDVETVMKALIAGSQNHQKAFERSLSRPSTTAVSPQGGAGGQMNNGMGYGSGVRNGNGNGLGIHRTQ